MKVLTPPLLNMSSSQPESTTMRIDIDGSPALLPGVEGAQPDFRALLRLLPASFRASVADAIRGSSSLDELKSKIDEPQAFFGELFSMPDSEPGSRVIQKVAENFISLFRSLSEHQEYLSFVACQAMEQLIDSGKTEIARLLAVEFEGTIPLPFNGVRMKVAELLH